MIEYMKWYEGKDIYFIIKLDDKRELMVLETRSEVFCTLEMLKEYVRDNDVNMPRWIFYKHDYEGQNKVILIVYNPTDAQDTPKEVAKLCTPKLKHVLRKFDVELPCKDLSDLTREVFNMKVKSLGPPAKSQGMTLLPLNNKHSHDHKEEDTLEQPSTAHSSNMAAKDDWDALEYKRAQSVYNQMFVAKHMNKSYHQRMDEEIATITQTGHCGSHGHEQEQMGSLQQFMKEYSLRLQQNVKPDAKDADFNRLKSQLQKQ